MFVFTPARRVQTSVVIYLIFFALVRTKEGRCECALVQRASSPISLYPGLEESLTILDYYSSIIVSYIVLTLRLGVNVNN